MRGQRAVQSVRVDAKSMAVNGAIDRRRQKETPRCGRGFLPYYVGAAVL